MKERLVELLNGAVDEVKQTCGGVNTIADYLLANGVIVPPCKVGETVYVKKGCLYLPHATGMNHNEVIPCEVIAIKQTKIGKYILLKPLIEETFGMRSANKWFPFSVIGKTVFLTREESETKLKEGGEE